MDFGYFDYHCGCCRLFDRRRMFHLAEQYSAGRRYWYSYYHQFVRRAASDRYADFYSEHSAYYCRVYTA